MVQAEPSGEPDSRFEPVLLDERAHAVLDAVRDVDHAHAGPDELACVLAHLPVHLRSAPNVVVRHLRVLHRHLLVVPLLFGRRAKRIAAHGGNLSSATPFAVRAQTEKSMRTRSCTPVARLRDISRQGRA